MFKSGRYRYLTTRKVAQQSGLPDSKAREFRNSGDKNLERIVGRYNPASGIVEWPPEKAGMFFFAADMMKQGYKAPLAAKLAVRVLEAHLASPTVEQWAVIVTENGNVSTLDFKSVDLATTGFISGSRLAFALIVDLRFYSERVEAVFAAIDAERAKAVSDA